MHILDGASTGELNVNGERFVKTGYFFFKGNIFLNESVGFHCYRNHHVSVRECAVFDRRGG